jgi:hypothetical protein
LPDNVEPDGTGVSLGDATGSRTSVVYGFISMPSEGLYVYARRNQYSSPVYATSNSYPVFWSEDLITWNEGVHDTGTEFSAPVSLIHDLEVGRAWWSGNDTFNSIDGKNFYKQRYWTGTANQAIGQSVAILPKGDYAKDTSITYIPGESSKVFKTNDSGVSAPIDPTQMDMMAGFTPTFHGPLTLNAVMNAIATDGIRLVVWQHNGYCQYSEDPVWAESWIVGAQSAAHGGPTNLFLDGTLNAYAFTFRDGNFWAGVGGGGEGNWYRSTTCEGNDWTQDDAGPFETTQFRNGSGNMLLETKTTRVPYAYCGSPTSIFSKEFVYFGDPGI